MINIARLPVNDFFPATCCGPAITALKSWPQYGHTFASHAIDRPHATQFLAGACPVCSDVIASHSPFVHRVRCRSPGILLRASSYSILSCCGAPPRGGCGLTGAHPAAVRLSERFRGRA
jgi:hypothetical protein